MRNSTHTIHGNDATPHSLHAHACTVHPVR